MPVHEAAAAAYLAPGAVIESTAHRTGGAGVAVARPSDPHRALNYDLQRPPTAPDANGPLLNPISMKPLARGGAAAKSRAGGIAHSASATSDATETG